MKYSNEMNEILEKISDINYLIENYFLLKSYVNNTKGKRDLKINDQFKHRIFQKPFLHDKKTKIKKPNLTEWGKELFRYPILGLSIMRIDLLEEL